MAQIVGNKVKLNNGQLIDPQVGAWYDSQQYWGGTLSAPGQINSLSNQQGAGKDVSSAVVAQTNQVQGLKPGTNEAYIASLRGKQMPSGVPSGTPSSVPGSTTGLGGGLGAGVAPAPTIDLNSIYQNLYDTSGISDLEKKLSEQEKAFIDVQGGINDNPFLSEATRLGRIAKSQELYDKRTASLKNDIATKKADIETQLNLKMKQFDINSQQAKDAQAQFNTLLSMGALNGASGEDIANLTRSTGFSSDMIMSAIKANQKTETPDTQVITSTADNGVVTVSVINKTTGDVISQKSLGAIGNKEKGPAKSDTPEESKYLSQASDVLKRIDESASQTDISGKKVGDNLLSAQEQEMAYQSILALVGGNTALADKVFSQAWRYGNYQQWNQ